MYYVLISKVKKPPSLNIYFENLFNENDTDCTAIYMNHA